MNKWRYDSVFAQVSFQFCGHLDEYLIRHVRHLGLLYHQTRFGKGGHLLRIYEEGVLVKERHLPSAHAIPLYYWRMWRSWHRELKRFCRGKESVTAVFEFPLLAVGMSLRRKVRHIFWQWDYFPGRGLTERMYDAVSRHYAPKCEYLPVSKAIAKVMGRPDAKVMMLGMVPPAKMGDPKSNRILMVGQLRGGQGIEHILDFIGNNKDYSLSLMGAAANGFDKEIAARIDAAKMADRVYFPNRFVSAEELQAEASKCFVALALYDTAPNNLTHYADPGKVKSCIEMGLPVVMTHISGIVPYLERFHAGEVIDSIADLPVALAKIRQDPESYFTGCRAFSAHFDFERYYAETLFFADCNLSGDLVRFPHAEKSCKPADDQWRLGGGVHSFSAEREQTISDLSRLGVLAKELSAELVRTVQHGAGASVRETSLALVAAAMRVGLLSRSRIAGKLVQEVEG